MAAGKIDLRAFTFKYKFRMPILRSPIWLAEPFDPANIPLNQIWKEFGCIWDTGASKSVITQKVITLLDLKPTGMGVCKTAAGDRTANTYYLSIKLPNNVIFPGVDVTEGIIMEPIDALIGMDIISLGDFAITNKNNVTWMSYQFPSNEEIDFVYEINRKKLVAEHPDLSDEERRKARNKRKGDARKNR